MTSQQLVSGLAINSKLAPDPICEPCLSGKMHANPFPLSESQTTCPLQLVHSDLHGPLPVRTHSGYRYWVSFIDDYTRFRVVFPLMAKSDTFEAFKVFKAYAENHLNAKIKALCDDKGGEYMSSAFLHFTTDAGISRQHTVRNRPQQNGVAERANRTMAEGVTAMLAESGLPLSFWGEALASFVHISICLPTASISTQTTPYQLWHGKKPDVAPFRVWGCLAYVHVQKDKRQSLGSHMHKCVFIGYPSGYKGWKFYDLASR